MLSDIEALWTAHADRDAVEAHFQILDRIVRAAGLNEEISGAALGGSLVRGAGDAYSDIDLFVLLREAAATDAIPAVVKWAAGLQGVEITLDRGVGPEGHDLLKGVDVTGIVLDFHVLTRERLQPVFRWRNRTAIFDRDGILTHFLAEQRSRWTDEAYRSAVSDDLPSRVTDFWLRYAKAYSYVMRKRLFLASRSLWNMTSLVAGVIRWKTGAIPSAIRAPLHYVEADLRCDDMRRLRECLPAGSGRRDYALALARTARLFDSELPQFQDDLARQLICRTRPIEVLEAVSDDVDTSE